MPPEMVAPLIDDKWWEGQVKMKKNEDEIAELKKILRNLAHLEEGVIVHHMLS